MGPCPILFHKTVLLTLACALILLFENSIALAQVTTDAGLNDLVILDPGEHERGLPAVVLGESDSGTTVEIAPKVHVHRFYYSGDKIFQGPIIQGGPTVLVVSHPKTGQKLYVNVVLPAGAPRIAYTKNTITYIYGNHRSEIKFRSFPFDPCVAIIKHSSGKGAVVTVVDASQAIRKHLGQTLTQSETINAAKDLTAGGGKLIKGTATTIGEASTRGADTIKQLAQLIPGIAYLSSKADERPQQQYEAGIRAATRTNELTEAPFVRTNR